MQISEKGAAFVRAHEGFVGHWYLDPVKIPTIGVGFTWRSTAFREWWAKNKPGVKFARGATMTRSEADDALAYLFTHEYGKAVRKALGPRSVRQNVYDCMCSVSYNCGPGSLNWKWAKAIYAGTIARAAALLKTTAVTADGRKLAGLVRRRKEEADLLQYGIYTGIGDVVRRPVDAMADGMLVFRERGPAVAELIRSLATLGYYDGVLDDLFGRGTEAAVLAFQRDHGLKADAKAGPVTLRAISEALKKKAAGKPANKPKSDAAAKEIDRIAVEIETAIKKKASDQVKANVGIGGVLILGAGAAWAAVSGWFCALPIISNICGG